MWKGNPGWEDKKSGEERLHEVSVLRLYYSNAMCIKESLKNDHKANGISIVNITKTKGNLNLIQNYSIKVSEK